MAPFFILYTITHTKIVLYIPKNMGKAHIGRNRIIYMIMRWELTQGWCMPIKPLLWYP